MLENLLECMSPALKQGKSILEMLKKFLIGLIVSSLFTQITLASQIFRLKDRRGKVTYSDTVTTGARRINLPVKTNRYLHQVKRVYDGDTIVLENGKRVRLLGVSAPEIEGRHRVSEPGGIAAKEWLQKQLQHKKIYLEYDQEKHDKYRRLLAYLFLPDGKNLNVALVKNGLATVSIMPPNIRYTGKFIHAQQHAEKLNLGIWSIPRYQLLPIAEISKQHKGWQRFLGKPRTIKKSRKYSRLFFDKQTNIRIANKNLALFPDLEFYLGKLLEIRGWVSRSKNTYSILIHHPSALIVK